MKYSIASIKNHQNRTANTSTPNTQHNQSFSLFYQIENTINFSISDSSKQKATLEQIKLDELEIQQKSLKLKNKFQRLLSSSAFRRKVTSQIPIKNKSLVNNGFRKVCYEYRRKSQQKKIYLRIIEEILSQSTNSNIAELLFSVHNKQILKQKKEQETGFHKVANGQLKNNKQQNMFEKVQDKKLKNILIITPKQIY